MKIIFDTYAWIEYFEGSKKGEIIKKYFEKEEILTPLIMLLELSYKAEKEGLNFKKLLNFIKIKSEIVGINEGFIFSFGKMYNLIKKIGITDIIILHTAVLCDAKVLTGDPHFSEIDQAIML